MEKFTKYLGILYFEYYEKDNFKFNIGNNFNFVVSNVNENIYGCVCNKVNGISIMFKFRKYIPNFGFAIHSFMNKIFTLGNATTHKRKKIILHLFFISVYFEYKPGNNNETETDWSGVSGN